MIKGITMHKYYKKKKKNTGALLSRINESIEYWKERSVDCRLINIIQEDDWYVAFIEREYHE